MTFRDKNFKYVHEKQTKFGQLFYLYSDFYIIILIAVGDNLIDNIIGILCIIFIIKKVILILKM